MPGCRPDAQDELAAVDGLTPEERHGRLKLGEKSEGFVRKALELATTDNSFLPRSFDVAEMQKDVELYFTLQSIVRELNRVVEGMNDTLMEAGSEAYVAALTVYRSAKDNGQGELLEGWLDELGRKFARKAAKVVEPTVPTP
ncbi:MAG: hypothetical protein HY870_22000 [Chloroflexi bacterium]|nr:hypothetical protein [Chloroflexota bacterium]